MTQKSDLKARLRAHGKALDDEVGTRPGLKERILSRALATPPAAVRRMPLFREAAIAAGVLLVAAGAGFGVVQLRAARQHLVDRPQASAAASATASASPAPTIGPRLSYTPGVRVPPGPIELGSVYTDMPLRMFTPLRGWAVGPSGKGNTGDRDALLLTVDGGNHWRNVTPPGSSGWTDRTNFFYDLGHAWVAVTQHVVQPGVRGATITVYRTSDGANSWQSSTFQVASGSPGQLQFVDPIHGWLMLQIDQGQALYRTSDGGVSWALATVSHYTAVGKPIPAGTLPLFSSYSNINVHSCQFDPFGAVGFLDASTGFAAGSCIAPSLTTYFYVTHDGGNTWEPQALPAFPGVANCPCRVVSSHPVFSSPRNGSFTVSVASVTFSCHAENGGQACGSNETPREAVVYVTADGGRSWTDHVLPGVAAYSGPDFVDGRNGWFSAVAVKSGGFPGETVFDNLYLTHDAGATWTALSTGGTFPGGTLNLISAREGWAFPSYSDLPVTLLHTVDGGRSWGKIFPSVDG